METTNYSNFRKKLKKYMEQVNHRSTPLTVTSQDDNDIVVLSKKDYDILQTNLELFQNEMNRLQLVQAKADIAADDVIEIDFTKEEDHA